MKKIEAFVKPHRLDKIVLALHHVEGLPSDNTPKTPVKF